MLNIGGCFYHTNQNFSSREMNKKNLAKCSKHKCLEGEGGSKGLSPMYSNDVKLDGGVKKERQRELKGNKS